MAARRGVSAAADALFGFTGASTRPGDAIYPPLGKLREISHAVAIAVGRALVKEGAAPEMSDADIERRVTANIWSPDYLPYRPA